ncbi:FGGY family carbohydrate kinase [Salipiger mangrovisoli]|uniref:ATP:glycerol 3-phosphotransferase n=1 Tax=Salipiger mangrovisoli TaxID=2865933 RepID=A0ABR9X5X1_9RHOB|nr:FGGY family carbohydrate kinase [Salipiger mangrovisoli]MBE9638846.1 glycerol kinase [Salipiger mangrovisoli]
MRVVALDQGTTSTRAIALNDQGHCVVLHAVAHAQRLLHGGCVEQDPAELLANLRSCADAAGPAEAIGIDNQGESCLAWDALTGEALTPVITWQDSRTLADLDRLRRHGCAGDVQARAGLPLEPYFSAAKLGWIVRNHPAAQDALRRGRLRLGTTDAFFLQHLTGRCVTDVSTASRTSLMNLRTLHWDETLCEIFGVPIQCLPEIVSTTGDFGAMNTAHGPVPVTASVVDQQAALFGFGCRNRGEAKITFGTGAFALMTTGAEIVDRPDLGLLPTVAWRRQDAPPVYAVDGGVFTASAAIDWARSLRLFDDYAELNEPAAPPAVSRGLVFVPALTGLGCPHWEPRARGLWTGLSLEHTRQDMMQSMLEGIAFRASEVIAAMDLCIPVSGDLFIDGGMSRNRYFTQFLSDVTGRVVRPAQMPELTGLGTLLLASEAEGGGMEYRPTFGCFEPRRLAKDYLDRFAAAVAVSRSAELAAP